MAVLNAIGATQFAVGVFIGDTDDDFGMVDVVSSEACSSCEVPFMHVSRLSKRCTFGVPVRILCPLCSTSFNKQLRLPKQSKLAMASQSPGGNPNGAAAPNTGGGSTHNGGRTAKQKKEACRPGGTYMRRKISTKVQQYEEDGIETAISLLHQGELQDIYDCVERLRQGKMSLQQPRYAKNGKFDLLDGNMPVTRRFGGFDAKWTARHMESLLIESFGPNNDIGVPIDIKKVAKAKGNANGCTKHLWFRALRCGPQTKLPVDCKNLEDFLCWSNTRITEKLATLRMIMEAVDWTTGACDWSKCGAFEEVVHAGQVTGFKHKDSVTVVPLIASTVLLYQDSLKKQH